MNQRILFRLTDGYMLVANTGKAFSKEGLKAVCYTDTSADDSESLADRFSEQETRGWLNDLLLKKQNTFFRDPDQLRSVAGTEQRTAGDYSGRLVLELLQNAIDAGREEQIGYKGIGFRSILNESQATEVHSGNLHVRWSEEDARAALSGLESIPERLPILDLPAWHGPDDEVTQLMASGYTTVICIKLTSAGCEHVAKEWRKYSSDPSLLLFINSAIELCWERENEPSILWNRNHDGNLVMVTKQVSRLEPSSFRWLTFAKNDAVAAFAVDESQRFQASEVSNPRLRCYFPASYSQHPFPNLFLHHGQFSLQSNRESVVLNDACLADLSEAIVLAASNIEQPADVLDLLQVAVFDPKDSAMPQTQVWKATRQDLSQAKLKGLNNRSLLEIKTCPKNDHLPHGWHDKARWHGWAAFLKTLSEHRSNGLAGLPVLQPSVENGEREATLLAFNPDCAFTGEQLQAQEWAPVETRGEPVASSSIAVFLPHGGEPLDAPREIEVCFLKGIFVDAFKAEAKKDVVGFLEKTLGVRKFSACEVIEHCILESPLLREPVHAAGNLIHFLKQLRDTDKKEATKESFDWNDRIRSQLIQKLQLSCRDGPWPVYQIYAGEGWTGEKFLEAAFDGDRGFLDMEPPDNVELRKSWEAFWKWLGVGWCPKVLPVLTSIFYDRNDKKGWSWQDSEFARQDAFQGADEPANWRDYCGSLRKDTSFTRWNYTPRMKCNWTLDGGESVLRHPGAFQCLAANWHAYGRSMESKIGFSSHQREDRDDCSASMPSYLAWLIANSSWLPGTDGKLHTGSAVFQTASDVPNTLPQFVVTLQHTEAGANARRTELAAEFLRVCGIRKFWNEVEDKDWVSWLNNAAGMAAAATECRETRKSIRSLYRALLEHRRLSGTGGNEPKAMPLEDVRFWGVERGSETLESWHLHQDGEALPYYVDRGDLADLTLPALRLFPVRLDGLEANAERHLGIKSLSSVLKGTPTDEGTPCSLYSDVIMGRVDELIAYLRIGNKNQTDDELRRIIRTVSLREIDELKVHFSWSDAKLAVPVRRESFHAKSSDGSWTLFVDASNCPSQRRWELVAEALLLSCGLPIDKRKEVRDLLTYPLDRLPEELMRLGVAPETVEVIRQARSLEQPPVYVLNDDLGKSQQPLEQGSVVSGRTSDLTVTGIEAQDSNAPEVPSAPGMQGRERTSSATTSNNQTRVGPSARPHPEDGIGAQKWLFLKLKEWCQTHGLPQPIWEQDDVDITIPCEPPILIEAKRIQGMTVHWSANQIKKAQDAHAQARRYFVALVLPKKVELEDDYEVFWVLRPLDQFGALSIRHVEWAWQVQRGTKFPIGLWGEPEPRPAKMATSFSAEIALDEKWVKGLPRGVNGILNSILPPS